MVMGKNKIKIIYILKKYIHFQLHYLSYNESYFQNSSTVHAILVGLGFQNQPRNKAQKPQLQFKKKKQQKLQAITLAPMTKKYSWSPRIQCHQSLMSLIRKLVKVENCRNSRRRTSNTSFHLTSHTHRVIRPSPGEQPMAVL